MATGRFSGSRHSRSVRERGRKYWLRLHRVERTRQRRGWTKKRLAEQVGYTRQHVTAVLNGRYAGSWELVGKMEERLGLEPGRGTEEASASGVSG
jgi:DNA-binding XRE family transcriptional regulator